MKYYADDGNVYHCSELDFYKHHSKWAFQGKFINGKIINEKYTVWYKEGQRHREDGPAFEDVDGTKEWWLNGNLHREDGPACEWAYGDKLWYKNGIPYAPTEHLKKLYEAGNL